jgi:DeoR/GlpR family transcriptional regulator of sugar metabolism
MLSAQRRQHILEDIEAQGVIAIIALSQKYNVSEMTIRRDLKRLADEGQLKRTRGGALRDEGTLIEPRYAAKQKVQASLKTQLARYAVEKLVQDGDIIILEGGTTVTAMAPYLSGKRDLTVVTNGLYTTNELHRLIPRHTVICSGGVLREVSSTFVGPLAERFFQELHAHKLFLSGTGFTLEAGLTDPSMLETPVKKAMIATAEQVIVLLDSSKFGLQSLTTVLPAAAVDVLVTDEAAPVELIGELQEQGVVVHRVDGGGL